MNLGPISDAIDGILGGVNDVVDDVFGIDLKQELGNLFDNDWFRNGLMAVSLFTGGVAIVNGVMQGFTQASAASGFMNTFVEGAKGFVSGLGQGLANPLETAGKIGDSISGALSGVGEAAGAAGANAATGTTTTGAGMTSEALAETGAAQDLLTSGADVGSGSVGGGSVGGQAANAGQAAGAGAEVAGQSNAAAMVDPSSTFQAPQIQDFGGMGQEQTLASSVNNAFSTPGGGDALSSAIQSNERGWLEMLKAGDVAGVAKRAGSGVMDFAKENPALMQTALQGVSGWAQGEALQERWDQIEGERRRRRESFQGFGDRAPSFDVPSLRSLRDRTQQIRDRGNRAQARYGY